MTEGPYNPESVSVIIVDDYDLIRKSIGRLMRRMGFAQIYDCANATEALKIFSQNQIDLVISDLYMTNGDGFKLLSDLRNSDTHSDVPFIVVTGEATKEDIVKAADLGADDYLLKPFQPEDLEKKINNVLAKYYSPSPVVKMIRLAEHLYSKKDLPTAMRTIDQALKLDPSSARANHLKALFHARSGVFEEALRLLKANIEANPSFFKSFALTADIYIKLKQMDHAVKALVSELDLNPKNAARQTLLAKILMSQGAVTEAIRRYRLALREGAKSRKALYGIGVAYAAEQNVEKAIYYFKRLRRVDPSLTKALEAMAKVGLDNKEPGLAEMALRDEKRSFPGRLDTYPILAKLLLATDKVPEALAVADEMTKKAPENLDGQMLKGMCLLKLSRIDDAIATFQLILSKEDSAKVRIHLADAMLKKNDFGGAIDTLHKALKYRQHLAMVLSRLATAHAKTGQAAKAWHILRRLRRLGVNDQTVASSEKDALTQSQARRRTRPSAA